MKKIFFIMILALGISMNNFALKAQSRDTFTNERHLYNQQGQLEKTWRLDSGGYINEYNNQGQLLRKFKSNSSSTSNTSNLYNNQGQFQGSLKQQGEYGNFYDNKGQLTKKYKSDSHGNVQIYNPQGQYQGTVKKDGTILNQNGRIIGRVK